LSGVRVRSAVGADLDELMLLERGMAEAPHWGIGTYAEILAEQGVPRCLLVTEVEGRLAGFAVGAVVGSVGEIETVAVELWARRRGVGRALCEAVLGWCGEQGATEVELEVREGSGGAQALYVGLGFMAVGERRRYYSDPVEDAVLMRLELAG